MAIEFDGVDDFLNCGTDDVVPEDADYSVYWRGKINSLAVDDAVLFFKVGSGVGAEAMGFRIDAPNGELRFWKEGTVYLGVITTTQVTVGAEVVIIATVVGGTAATGVHLYINGTEASYGTQTDGVVLVDSAGGNFQLGCKPVAGDPVNGIIREAAVFTGILSAGSIATLSQLQTKNVPLSIAGCIRYFRLDDGEDGTSADGDTIVDATGTANATGDNGANNTGLTWRIAKGIMTANSGSWGAI